MFIILSLSLEEKLNYVCHDIKIPAVFIFSDVDSKLQCVNPGFSNKRLSNP